MNDNDQEPRALAALAALAAPAADAPRTVGVPAELAGFAIQAKTMDEAMKVCQWLANSPLIPKSYQGNPAAIWTAGAMGQKLGIDLFTAMTGIASINGRPAIWGDLLRGLVLAHPMLAALEETMEGAGDTLTAVCSITRKGMEPYVAKFGVADAKAAGLLNKDGPWRNYTADMLVNRAFGRAARRRFADVLSGLHVAEEMQDAREVEGEVVRTERGDVVPDAQAPRGRAAKAAAKAAAASSNETGTTAPSSNETASGVTSAPPAAEPPHAPKPPPDPRVAILVAEAKALHASGAAGAAEVRAIAQQLSVVKLENVPAARLDEALGKVRTGAKALNVTLPAAP